jgi:hypothetical protein
MNEQQLQSLIEYVKTPAAIRKRCGQILELALNGSTNFEVDLSKIKACANFVAQVTKERFPDLHIPPHSRWGHFNGGGIDRLSNFENSLAHLDKQEKARRLLDLVIVSVLLDAGAGASWKYTDTKHGTQIGRSEGLAIASLDMFNSGLFSGQNGDLMVTASGLENISLEGMAKSFQSSPGNLLEGLEGRVEVIRKLAGALRFYPDLKIGDDFRPGAILDVVTKGNQSNEVCATNIFKAVLELFGPVWPAHPNSLGIKLGDVWEHPGITGVANGDNLIPFHKLSLWLTFSLFHGFETAGYKVKNIDMLPGLAEYRNGGLLVDLGVLKVKDQAKIKEPLDPGDLMIIEWRALTISLIDKVADELRIIFGKTREEFPLAAALEGGTWFAGRRIASQLRPDSSPPIPVLNKGTVF